MRRVLLFTPSVYDFALFDQFYKPFALMRMAGWFGAGGWEVVYVNALDIHDEYSESLLGRPRRNGYGQGHFFRDPMVRGESFLDFPDEIFNVGRHFSRYGILIGSLRERLMAAFGENVPDLILIASGMTYWYKGVEEAVRLCREVYPGVTVVVGGVYASLMEGHCMGVCRPDGVFMGHSAADFNGLMGVLLPGVEPVLGEIPVLPDLMAVGWGDSAVLRLNRGCFMDCDYCVSGLLSNGFVMGSPELWFDWLLAQYYGNGIRHFAFYDDALLGRCESVLLPFLQRVIDARLDVSFYCPNALHIRLITAENARMMRAAGFVEIRLGYESDEELFHEVHDRKYGGGDFKRAVVALHGAGFLPGDIRAYVLGGLPRQRWQELEGAVRYAAACGVQPVIAEFSPVPGCGLWQECCEKSPFDIANEPLFQNNTFFPMEWEGFTKKDMAQLKNLARNSLRL